MSIRSGSPAEIRSAAMRCADDSSSVAPLARGERQRVAGQIWILNVLLLTLLCGQYSGAARPETARGWIFLETARLSCAATLSLLPGVLCAGFAAVIRARRVLALLSGVVWTLALFAVYVDTRIYALFRYHFNGLVWNVLT